MNEQKDSKQSGMKARIQRLIARALQLRIVRAFLLYSEQRGSSLADSITYRALFSVFAAVLLGFSLAALWLGGNPDAMRALTDALDSAIPGLSDIVDPEKIELKAGFTIAGIASLVGLVGAAISAITSLRTALRVLSDGVADDGFFLWVLLRNLLVAIGFGGLLIVSAVLSMLTGAATEMVAGWIGSSSGPLLHLVTRVLGIVIAFAVDTVAIVLIFVLLSGIKAPARTLWGGAMIGGAGLVVLQEFSSLFVRGATSNPLLGTFAALIALLLWFNLSAQVILISSSYIIVGATEARDRIRERYGAETLAQYKRRRAEDRLQAATRELRAAQDAARKELEAQSGQAALTARAAQPGRSEQSARPDEPERPAQTEAD